MYDEHILLSPAEAQVLVAIVDEGLTNAQIAERFYLSHGAVASRLHRFYERTLVANRAGAAAFAALHRQCCVDRALRKAT
jgi:DNA-binding NarL/FixJ family response regulator